VELCFHCQETVPPGSDFRLALDGTERRFCCPGCRAVAEWIGSAGLGRFYAFRTAPSLRAPAEVQAETFAATSGAKSGAMPGAVTAATPAATSAAERWAVCDRPEVMRRLVRPAGAGAAELAFAIDGINCAACVWLIDRGLRSLDGVTEVSVNPVSREAVVRFDPGRARPSAILAAVERFGFSPRLGAGGAGAADAAAERSALKRLAVAGLGYAQVMTLSAALYLGAFKEMATSFVSFFALASMLIATPVVLYAGAPIFRAALADLARRRLGMDVTVSLAIVIALAASLVNALRGEGQVYFDSATMFVFFLTLGRFLEARARHRAGSLVTALAELKPLSALRRKAAGLHGGVEVLERVGTVELLPGDVVIVAPGEAVPTDGELVSTAGTLDESLLSGESLGRRRECGETVLGGSLNVGRAPLEIRVSGAGNDGYIERVGSLLTRAVADRPEFLALADRFAAVFVALVLAATAVAGAVWLRLAPERALEVVLAMLVVTCPCALSLAAPTAFAVALGRLARQGLLCRSARVLERLGQVGVWLFDKTGTLSEGRIGVVRVDVLGELAVADCVGIAAALEAGIEHPIARALRGLADTTPANAVEYAAGFGVAGEVGGSRYRLGSARYIGVDVEEDGEPCVYLAAGSRPLARFVLADRLRASARTALASLGERAEIAIVSGDSPAAVRAAARALDIDDFAALMTPADKLALLEARQAAGEVVAAVGDGINDAPFLARADVSIAMVAGSKLAQVGADIVFTGDDLGTLARLPELARRTRAVVRQNLVWAALYNFSVLPLAAAGLLEPWMAALGMSLSSLFVVGNALRLNRLLADRRTDERSNDRLPGNPEFGTCPLPAGEKSKSPMTGTA
jgi:Cu2+-exporting ATPase